MKLIIKKRSKQPSSLQSEKLQMTETQGTPSNSNDTSLSNFNINIDSSSGKPLGGRSNPSIVINFPNQQRGSYPRLFDEPSIDIAHQSQGKQNNQQHIVFSFNPINSIAFNKKPSFMQKLSLGTSGSGSTPSVSQTMSNSYASRLFTQSLSCQKLANLSRGSKIRQENSLKTSQKLKSIDKFIGTRPRNSSLKESTRIYRSAEQFLSNQTSSQQNIKVYVRIKPLQNLKDKECVYHLNPSTISMGDRIFAFDEVFQGCSTQQQIFRKVGIPVVDGVFEGLNGTIFAYGQTGSGKTYTIFGAQDIQNRGIIAKTISYIYTKSINLKKNIQSLRCSMLEIYKESLIDMFQGSKSELKLKEGKSGIFIDGLSEKLVESQAGFLAMIFQGQKNRRVAKTKINQKSSRSHTILTITIKFEDFQCKLCLIDLAGSQKVNKAGVKGQIFQETKKINYSLSCLGNVINALTTRKKSDHIPFRDSKLTRILKESLSGRFRTSIIVNCSAQEASFDQTMSSLKFAERAKKVKINPRNVGKTSNIQSVQYLHSVIRKLTNDLNSTKKELHKYKAICNNITLSSSEHSNSEKQETHVNKKIEVGVEDSYEQLQTCTYTCRPIPSERANVSESMRNYQQNQMKQSTRSKKIQISLLNNNLSSLNISRSAVNPMSGVCSPSLSSLSFRELNSSVEQSSFALSLCKEDQLDNTIKQIKNPN